MMGARSILTTITNNYNAHKVKKDSSNRGKDYAHMKDGEITPVQSPVFDMQKQMFSYKVTKEKYMEEKKQNKRPKSSSNGPNKNKVK